MNRIKLMVSHLKSMEMDWDNYFAHRIYGAIGLSKVLIAKQAIALQKLDNQTNTFAANLNKGELAFIDECIKDYNQCLKQNKPSRLTDDDFEYGVDFKLSEIAELLDERVMRKIELDLAFVQVKKETHSRRSGIRLAVTGG